MKTILPFLGLLASLASAEPALATTYSGVSCRVLGPSLPLFYRSGGAQPAFGGPIDGAHEVSITCPASRYNDGGTAPVTGVIYFVDDTLDYLISGRPLKACYLENYDIDDDEFGLFAYARGTSRLEMQLPATHAWFPLSFTCAIVNSTRITGYYIAE